MYPLQKAGNKEFINNTPGAKSPCCYSIILFVDFVDNSGFRLTVTPTLRAHDAAIISVQSAVDKSQVIPPHQPNFVTTAYCNQSTLQQVRVKIWSFKTNINDGFTFKNEQEGSHLSISMLLSPDYVAVFFHRYIVPSSHYVAVFSS